MSPKFVKPQQKVASTDLDLITLRWYWRQKLGIFGRPKGGKSPFTAKYPNPLFDVVWYLNAYPDVRDAGVNPYLHYQADGIIEGRDPNLFFDTDWYLEQNPDVKASGMNPLDHYLFHGAGEGRDPGPAFSSLFYLMQNPDVRKSGLNPLLHFLLHGKAEQRLPRPPARDYYLPSIEPSRQVPHPPGPLISERLPGENDPLDLAVLRFTRRLAAATQQTGPVDAIILLPLLGRGGSEKVAMSFAQRLRDQRPDASVLMLVTDRDMIDPELEKPHGVIVFRLADFLTNAPQHVKQKLLFRIIKLILPRIVHVINSDIGWNLLRMHGSTLRELTRVYGSMFNLQHDYETGEMIGYAATYFPDIAPYLEALLSDNKRFFKDLRTAFPQASTDVDMRAVYNPVTWSKASPQFDTANARKFERPRPHFLWAGRLDRQKRIEIVFDVAERMPDCDFSIFGSSVTDGAIALRKLPNVYLRGAFTSPQQLVADHAFAAYLFTTREEGMPNILIEIGNMSLPIVAPDIGGISELVADQTGYLLSSWPDAEEYVKTLRFVLENSDDAAQRAGALKDLIEQRHGWDAFSDSVAAIPNYLD